MKKWIYFIVPIIGLGIFLFFYVTHVEEAKKTTEIRRIDQEKKDADEAARKKDLENRARQDADRLAAERAAKEAKKIADDLAMQASEDNKVKVATDTALAECDKFTKEVARLEKEIAALHAAKDKANREFLDLSKQLELARISRRNAELEVQRKTAMIANKASEAAMAKFVPPPAPVAR